MWQQSLAEFKQVRFLVIYPAISVVMLVLVYLVKTPMICFVGAFVIGYAAAGGVLQMAAATVNDLFPNIKGIITSLVMIASSLCNYTILSAAAKMSSMQVIMMNIVITVIGVLLAVFVNVRYGTFRILSDKVDILFNIVLFNKGCLSSWFSLDEYPIIKSAKGIPALDECYGYVPALALGGKEAIDNIHILKTIPYIEMSLQSIGDLKRVQ